LSVFGFVFCFVAVVVVVVVFVVFDGQRQNGKRT